MPFILNEYGRQDNIYVFGLHPSRNIMVAAVVHEEERRCAKVSEWWEALAFINCVHIDGGSSSSPLRDASFCQDAFYRAWKSWRRPPER